MAKPRSSRSSRSSSAPPPEAAMVETILEGLWHIVLWFFGLLWQGLRGSNKRGGNGSKVHLQELREHWEQVEFYLLQEHTRALAVSEADKILDSALKHSGYRGESMADRLRAAENRFSHERYQSIWEAHKLRNTLAHEVGATLSAAQAQQAVASIRIALYDLKVLV